MNTESIKASLGWHLESIKQIWSILPLWVLLMPLVFMLLLYGLEHTAVSAYLDKDSAEVAAPSILGIALLIAVIQIFRNNHVYFRWQAFFSLILFFRELHFYGTNNGFYIGFLLLIWWASRYRDRLTPYFKNKTVVTLIVTIIWTYLVSKSFDRHYWDNLLPAGISSDLFEENLELIAHLLFFILVILSSRLETPSTQANSS